MKKVLSLLILIILTGCCVKPYERPYIITEKKPDIRRNQAV